jgi:hypothetical protein
MPCEVPVPIISRQKPSRLPLPDDVTETLETLLAAMRFLRLTCVNDRPGPGAAYKLR